MYSRGEKERGFNGMEARGGTGNCRRQSDKY